MKHSALGSTPAQAGRPHCTHDTPVEARTSAQKIMQECGIALAEAGLDLGAVLGCGMQGCVVEVADDDRVLKVTCDQGEALFHKFLAEQRRKAAVGMGTLPSAFPWVSSVFTFACARRDRPYYGILREDLRDVPWDSMDKVRQRAVDDTLDHASRILGDFHVYEHAKYLAEIGVHQQSVDPVVRQLAQDMLEIIAWAKERNVLIDDLGYGNWGIRGSTWSFRAVMRDLGFVSRAPAPERPPQQLAGVVLAGGGKKR